MSGPSLSLTFILSFVSFSLPMFLLWVGGLLLLFLSGDLAPPPGPLWYDGHAAGPHYSHEMQTFTPLRLKGGGTEHYSLWTADDFYAFYWGGGRDFDFQRPAKVLTSAQNMQAVAGERAGRENLDLLTN